MLTYNPKYRNYLAPLPYLISHFIYEYDISKANISILLYKGIINKEEFNRIKKLPRDQRQIYVGYMQKDKKVSKALSEGLGEFRRKFLTDNNINDMELLSVKNDAIFLIDRIPTITIFDNIEFIKKNTYTSYFYLNKLEVYYYLDRINDREIIDIKGVNDANLLLHQGYFIEFLCSVFESIQIDTIENTIEIINNFHDKYINRKLPIGYYRELNADSEFRITMDNNQSYLLKMVDNSNIGYLNIMFNLNIIRELYAIVSNIYFSKRK